MMYAALYGEAATVKLLLSRGADPNAKTTAGTTALMLASGDIDKVRMLVDRGAKSILRPAWVNRTGHLSS